MKTAPWIPTAVLAATLVAGLGIAEPVLHEYFELGEDGAEGVSAAGGATPQGQGAEQNAALANNAPNPQSAGQAGSQAGNDAYQLDSDTTRPEQVGYEDPFTPAIPPFKRLYAYDAVDAQFQLVVSDGGPFRVAVGEGVKPATSLDDQFYGDLQLTLQSGVAERIPSVGPGARLIAARLQGDVRFKVEQDSAENWFLSADRDGTFQLTMHLAIPRAVFGSAYGDPEWREVERLASDVPAAVKRRGVELANNLGVSRNLRVRDAVSRLVSHFRSFAPSEELPTSAEPGALYREIALSKRGVCRHRAYAFTVTALSLGIPTRFVRNDAHAWVEVHDATLWHRIDLGGAAGEMQFGSNVDLAHVAPEDPFEWPKGSESAQEMTDAALSNGGPQGRGQGAGAEESTAPANSADVEPPHSEATAPQPSVASQPVLVPSLAPHGSVNPPPEASAALEAAPSESAELSHEEQLLPEAPPSHVEIEPHDAVVMQGARVRVAGRVQGPDGPCVLVRVDVVLRSEERSIPVGTLVTDEQGRYFGEVTLPGSVPVGDYELRAVTRGAPECGAGSSL
jgi:hypothetical protein